MALQGRSGLPYSSGMRGRCIGAVSLLGAAALLVPSAMAQQTVQQADASCAKCHAEIVRSYLKTAKANASGRATDHLLPGEFASLKSGVRYTIAREGNDATLRFANSRVPQASGGRRLDYFLGSGHLGLTYLYVQDGYLLESPVAWYASTGRYDMKPGIGDRAEMPPAIPMEPTCLRCHMSAVSHALPGSINRYSGLPFAQTGITCESCHGDTAGHVRSGGRSPVLNPAKMDAERRDSICMSCHLEGDVAVERPGRSSLDFKPGDRLADFLSFFVFEGKDPLSRGVSEVEQFSLSQCKRVSGDRMSCTTCHDPHASILPAERVAFYRSKCLACHGTPDFVAQHHPEEPSCIDCHMPRSRAQNIPHVAWTDHRILRRPELAPTALAEGHDGRLVPILSPKATKRDAAVALYHAIVAGKSRAGEAAIADLKEAYQSEAHDPQVLEGLGVLTGIRGNAAESERYLRELLLLQPQNLTGLADLGVLLGRQGKMQAAVALWQPVFAQNEDLIGLARNLSMAQCAAGVDASARATMDRALSFSPGDGSAREFACSR